jgi:hypothetical protein
MTEREPEDEERRRGEGIAMSVEDKDVEGTSCEG